MSSEKRCTACEGRIEVEERHGRQEVCWCEDCASSFDVLVEQLGQRWVAVGVLKEHAPGSSADDGQTPRLVFLTQLS